MGSNPLNPVGDVPETGIPGGLSAEMTMAEQHEWHQEYLRRHRVSRRNVLRGAAAAAAVAAVGTSPFGGRAYAQDAPLA
ncbi:twin-arginine translocation signal domain-containing protein, partial [Nocardia ninae]